MQFSARPGNRRERPVPRCPGAPLSCQIATPAIFARRSAGVGSPLKALPHRLTPPKIRLRGAREHNLRGLDLDLRVGEHVVLTGVSGSGKSSLAWDTVAREGMRRLLESLAAPRIRGGEQGDLSA